MKPFLLAYMKSKTYSQKLLDPRWQKMRLEKLSAQDWTCELCGSKENTLHVHHNWYVGKIDPWDYDDDQLSVLCEPCHKKAHDVMYIVQQCLSRIKMDGPENMESLMWFLVGMVGWDVDEEIDHEWQKKCYLAGRSFICFGD